MTGSAKVSLLLLRLGFGWVFFYAGWSKVVTYFTAAEDWTAAGYLSHLPGPFADFFSGMAGNALVDNLNAYGLLLIGIALLLGVLVRWAAFWGIVLMLLYYISGFPPEHAYVIDDHIIYALVFLVLAAVGAGRMWGLDKSIEDSSLVKSNPWVLKLLG
jgi:thiosulfate dehydrogenase [quinone] large subunit